jgi:hypothetical protein
MISCHFCHSFARSVRARRLAEKARKLFTFISPSVGPVTRGARTPPGMEACGCRLTYRKEATSTDTEVGDRLLYPFWHTSSGAVSSLDRPYVVAHGFAWRPLSPPYPKGGGVRRGVRRDVRRWLSSYLHRFAKQRDCWPVRRLNSTAKSEQHP